MNFINMLAPWQWAAIAAVPPAIVALYFLKLKRLPREVPSTYLWRRTVEDLHVNSIWQRLRRNLLLLLQLLVVLLAILACLRPGWRGTQLVGDRFIFLVDTSASMSATDVAPSRLELAKQRVLALIDQMSGDEQAMVISFSDETRVEQSFTSDRGSLRQAVQRIKPTPRRTDLSEALRAASGLANPGRTSEAGTADVQVADPLPATLYIYSDGGVPAVPEFSLGNLTPKYVAVGVAESANVGIVAFTTDRHPEKPEQLQAFARLQNSGPEEVTVHVNLYLNDQLVDASTATIPAGDDAGVSFAMQDSSEGVLKLEVAANDHLSSDNTAYATLNLPRRARVLVATPGNPALQFALTTDEVAKTADVRFVAPDALKTEELRQQTAGGAYDLVIFDRCTADAPPQANTLFIGAVPSAEWAVGEKKLDPNVIDTDRVHPLTQLVQVNRIRIYEAAVVKPPPGTTVLIDGDAGPLLLVAPRQGFEDAVLTFELHGAYENGDVGSKTTWIKERSFPVFVMNVLRYLGGARGALAVATTQPGQPIGLRTESPADRIVVESPSGQRTEVRREGQSAFVFTGTHELGVYGIIPSGRREVSQRFSVNLFDARESDLRPRPEMILGHEVVAQARSASEPTRQETWKWLLVCGLGLLVFEWYIFNRRVYL